MAHIHFIEDNHGDAIDLKVYCSDSCNILDNRDSYQGWNGCQEISSSQYCCLNSCQNIIEGLSND